MALWDRVTQILALEPWNHREVIQERVGDDSSIADLMARYNVRETVWRRSGIREALGIPAIFRAASFIANTTGALSMHAYRRGVRLPDEDRPIIIVRPDPFRIPRDFYRDTAWNMATRGEAWWWIAKRDIDGMPLSLLSISPREINVTIDENDLRRPVIEWRGVKMRNEDMRQLTYVQEPGELRGVGPLQLCGAAVSVAVEAQEWAANFYAEGGKGGTLIKSASQLAPGEEGLAEADLLRAQWVARGNNLVRIIDPNIESVEEHEPNEAGAQMLESRDYQNGEAARMFGIDGALLEFASAGSSLTYQNIGQMLDKVTRTCLWPNYFEPIEQTMSDLLTRSTVARFNLEGLLRADIKTRYDVHAIAIDKGIYDQSRAQEIEGLLPGDVENAPVPFSSPQAIPTSLPIEGRSELREVRCPKHPRRLIGKVSGAAELWCKDCKAAISVAGPAVQERVVEAPTPSLEVHNHFPPDFVRVESPVTVNSPDVHVEPTFNAPEPAPLTVQIEHPESVKQWVASVIERVDEVGQDLAEQRSTDSEAINERITEMQAKYEELAAKMAVPRVKRFIPKRDPITQQIVDAIVIDEPAA